MGRRITASLAASLTAILACTALAQDTTALTPAPIEDATLVDSLVVKGTRPGPAFWKVSDGDSTVWVMGVPAALPKGTTWKHDELKAHLRNANVLIVGTGGVTFNIVDIFRLVFSARQFRADQPLDKVISPPLMARYTAAMQPYGGISRANELKPGFASLVLSGSFMRSLDMENGQPEKAISRDAFLRVRSERVGRSPVIDLIKMFNEMPLAAAEVCMDDAIRQVEAGKTRQMEAARGWTSGDLRVAIGAERGWERCIADDPRIAADTERNTAEVTRAILDALKKPGKSVAVADLRTLLSHGGILVRLQATPGVTLTPPDAPGLESEIEAEAAAPEAPRPNPEPKAPAA